MKMMFLMIMGAFFLSKSLIADNDVIRPVRTIRPISRRVYVPVKTPFKQLRISKLPMKGTKVDVKKVLLNSSIAKKVFINSFTPVQKRLFTSVITSLKGNQLALAKRNWSNLINTFKNKSNPYDINEILYAALNNAYIKGNKELNFYSLRAGFIKKQIEEMESHYSALRALSTNGSVSDEWETYIKKLEEDLASVGDDAQLANIDLQNALQKQQQTLQTLSNVSKLLHDTAMAVIRKIG